MNKIFKVVMNKKTGQYNVASELAKSEISSESSSKVVENKEKKSSTNKNIKMKLLSLSVLFIMNGAYAANITIDDKSINNNYNPTQIPFDMEFSDSSRNDVYYNNYTGYNGTKKVDFSNSNDNELKLLGNNNRYNLPTNAEPYYYEFNNSNNNDIFGFTEVGGRRYVNSNNNKDYSVSKLDAVNSNDNKLTLTMQSTKNFSWDAAAGLDIHRLNKNSNSSLINAQNNEIHGFYNMNVNNSANNLIKFNYDADIINTNNSQLIGTNKLKTSNVSNYKVDDVFVTSGENGSTVTKDKNNYGVLNTNAPFYYLTTYGFYYMPLDINAYDVANVKQERVFYGGYREEGQPSKYDINLVNGMNITFPNDSIYNFSNDINANRINNANINISSNNALLNMSNINNVDIKFDVGHYQDASILNAFGVTDSKLTNQSNTSFSKNVDIQLDNNIYFTKDFNSKAGTIDSRFVNNVKFDSSPDFYGQNYAFYFVDDSTLTNTANNQLTFVKDSTINNGYNNKYIGLNNVQVNNVDDMYTNANNVLFNSTNTKIGEDVTGWHNAIRNSYISGENNNVKSSVNNTHILGFDNTIESALNSNNVGFNNTLNTTDRTNVMGAYNNVKNSIGDGTFGRNNTLDSTSQNLILGFDNTLNNSSNNIILGKKNQISNVADAVIIGSSNIIDDGRYNNGVVLGNSINSNTDLTQGAFLTNENAVGQVAIGSSYNGGETRITNVSNGFNDNDVVTVYQLKALDNKIIMPNTSDDSLFVKFNPNDSTDLLVLEGVDGTKITNVQSIQTDNTSLATGSDLNSKMQNIADILGGGVQVENNQFVNGFTVNNVTYNSVIDALNNYIPATNLTHITNSDGNLTIDKVDKNYEVSLSKVLNLDSISTNDGSTTQSISFNNNGLVTNNGEMTINENGSASNNVTFENIAKGSINPTSKDAVTTEMMNNLTNQFITTMGGNLTNNNGLVDSGFIDGKNSAAELINSYTDNFDKTTMRSSDGNLVPIKTTNNTFEVGLNNVINIAQVNLNGTIINKDGLTVNNGPSLTISGLNANDTNVSGLTNESANFGDTTNKNGVSGSALNSLTNTQISILQKDKNLTNTDGVIGGQLVVNNNNYANVEDAILNELSKKAETITTLSVPSGDNLSIINNPGNKYVLDISNNPDLNSIEFKNNGGTVISDNEIILNGKTFIKGSEINLSNNKIINSIDGQISSTSQDAVTGSQLDNLAKNITDVFGGNLINKDGVISGLYEVNSNKYNNIAEAISKEASMVKSNAGSLTVLAGNNIDVVYDSAIDDYKISTKDDLNAASLTLGNTTLNSNELNLGGVNASRGYLDANNVVVKNIADGLISNTSKDAVNGSQLFTSGKNITDIMGGGTQIVDGQITTGFTVDNVAYRDVAKAIEGEFMKNYTTLSTSDNNLQLDVNKDTKEYTVSTKNDLVLDGINLGNTKLNQDGLSLASGIKVSNNGFDLGDNKITNVKDAVEDSDAINVGQLKTEISKIKTDGYDSWTYSVNNGAVNKVTNENNHVEFNNQDGNMIIQTSENGLSYNLAKLVNIDGTVINGLGNNINTNGTVLNKDGLAFNNGITVKNNINANNTIVENVNDGLISETSKEGINGSQIFDLNKNIESILGSDIVYNSNGQFIGSNIGGTGETTIDGALNKLNVKSKTVNNIKSGDNQVVVDKLSNSTGGNDYKISVNKATHETIDVGNIKITEGGIDLGNNNLSNMGEGKIVQDGKDLATTGQLWDLKESVINRDGLITVKDENGAEYVGEKVNVIANSPNLNHVIDGENITINLNDDLKVSEITLSDGLKLEKGATANMGDNIVHNVGDAIYDNDAINMKQLNEMESGLDTRLNDTEKKIKAGAAAAIAMESAPHVTGKITYALTMGHFGGESALAGSLRKTSDNGNWSVSSSVSGTTQGNAGVKVGYSRFFN